MSSEETVLDTPHFKLTRSTTSPILKLYRTGTPFDKLDDIGATFARMLPTLDELGRENHRLLIDLRSGPSRHDPEFEEAFREYRQRMVAGFPKVAVLVRSAAGFLQVTRHSREDESTVRPFEDEVVAVRWLEHDVS